MLCPLAHLRDLHAGCRPLLPKDLCCSLVLLGATLAGVPFCPLPENSPNWGTFPVAAAQVATVTWAAQSISQFHLSIRL